VNFIRMMIWILTLTKSHYLVWYVCTFPNVLLSNQFVNSRNVIKREQFFEWLYFNSHWLHAIKRVIKSGIVDVWLEFEFKEDVPANTTAYCLILHDRVIEYSLT